MPLRGIWEWAALVGALAGAGAASAGEPTLTVTPALTTTEANPAAPAAGHSLHGETFDDGPRQRATLKEGMGRVDFAATATAASPEARAFLNQGVAQLHSFYYFEAERSFRQTASLDPVCAMAYWGMAMANVNNAPRARGFLKEARKHVEGLSSRERLYLNAADAFVKEEADEKARKRAFILALETIVQEYPDDLDAKAWLAMAAWQSYQEGSSRQAIESLIEAVERAAPQHPGAHHYRIHLWDGAKPALAERSAGLYASTAPGIAHAWHMPGHTFSALHRYADAAYQQEGSARVDHAAMAADRVMPFEIHNYAHNNQWLATTLSHLGRVRDAVAVARNLVEQPRDPKKNSKSDGGSAQRSGRLRWSEVLARYELWDDLLAATTTGALDWSDEHDEVRERAYTLGLAFAAKRDAAKLAEQASALRALADADANKAAEAKTPAPAPLAQLAELEGYQKLAAGDVAGAFERFGKATAMRPEALARAHVRARNFGLAESTAQAAVEVHPGEVAPLSAYVEVLHAAGRAKEAGDAARKLAPIARFADADLPVLRRLGPLVAPWREPAPSAETTAPPRVDLATLGPLTFQPWEAAPIVGADDQGHNWSLAEHKGRNVVVLLYLGEKCPHCLQQLQVFGKEMDAFKALHTDLVAIGTDGPEAIATLKANPDGIKFPIPMLADPDQKVFGAFRARDDFEDRPLHGVFLLDGEGRVRYQRISAEPLLDAAFLKAEAARINRLAGH